VPYGKTAYYFSLVEKLKVRKELREVLRKNKVNTNRVDEEIANIAHILERYQRMPEWRNQYQRL
jgi:hypothetical protein